MAQPYLLTRTLDPLFALFIGSTSAWLRIRREEVERAVALASTTNLSSPALIPSQDLITSSREVDSIEKGKVDRLGQVEVDKGDVGVGGVRSDGTKEKVKIPTNLDTWNEVVRRVGNVRLRDVDVRDLWRKRDAWGTYEPNAVVIEKGGRTGE